MLLAAGASGRSRRGAAHAGGAAAAIDSGAAAVTQTGATLVLVVIRTGLGRAAAAVGLAQLLGSLCSERAILVELAAASVLERAASHCFRGDRQRGHARRATLSVRVADIRLGARAAIALLATARGHREYDQSVLTTFRIEPSTKFATARRRTLRPSACARPATGGLVVAPGRAAVRGQSTRGGVGAVVFVIMTSRTPCGWKRRCQAAPASFRAAYPRVHDAVGYPAARAQRADRRDPPWRITCVSDFAHMHFVCNTRVVSCASNTLATGCGAYRS